MKTMAVILVGVVALYFAALGFRWLVIVLNLKS